MKTTTLMMTGLLVLTSCGKSSNSDSPSSYSQPQMEQTKDEGSYRGILRPLNYQLAGWIPYGKIDLSISQNQIQVRSWLDDATQVPHLQAIHWGNRCPQESDDVNADGFVDIQEAMRVSGKAYLPLDGDLNSQNAGSQITPYGNFAYNGQAIIQNILNDLKRPLEPSSDYLIKLPLPSLNLEGKVVMVLGINGNRQLPASVASLEGKTPQATIPIACGVIKRL